jgi:ankyrin repeat protein
MFPHSQEKTTICQDLLNLLEKEEISNVKKKPDLVWKQELMVKAIRKNNFKYFSLLIFHGGKLGADDFECLVNKIEDESETFAKKRYLIKFLSKIRDQFNQTLIHHAALKGKLKCLKILIGCKLNVYERKTEEEQTPCLVACKNGESKCAWTLFKNNVSVNIYDFKRRTPLYFAAKKGHQECLELLIKKGGDVNVKDIYDTTPLHYVVFFGKVDCLEVLLANGADVNARDNTQKTPLHIIGWSPEGSKAEKERCAEILIAAGADIDAKDEDGDTIFSYQFFQDFNVEKPDLFVQN